MKIIVIGTFFFISQFCHAQKLEKKIYDAFALRHPNTDTLIVQNVTSSASTVSTVLFPTTKRIFVVAITADLPAKVPAVLDAFGNIIFSKKFLELNTTTPEKIYPYLRF